MRTISRKRKLKFLLLSIVVFLCALVVYRIYYFSSASEYLALNMKNIARIDSDLKDRVNFSFAVVGNVKNSTKIFDMKIAPMISDKNIDFLISAGNAVFNGGEDKYRLLNRSFKELQIPYLLAVGKNELLDSGLARFYRHFGPPCFSFQVRNAYFIFLDTTGETSWDWQLPWLSRELDESDKYTFRFIVMSHPPFELPRSIFDNAGKNNNFELHPHIRQLFSDHEVTCVFSSDYPVYYCTRIGGVPYIVSGCGGGLLLDEGKESYQYIKVDVTLEKATWGNVKIPHDFKSLHYKLRTLGFFIHSLLHVNLFNFLLLVGVFSYFALKVYSLIIKQEHLYRDFSIDESFIAENNIRVAMFTNNYLPFIGGVPISIDRLCHGLSKLGVVARVFAPLYPRLNEIDGEKNVFRYSVLFHVTGSFFPVANVFSRKSSFNMDEFKPDIVHVHHPFWLGKKGLKLAQRSDLPVVLTYHTRLDRYSRYIPLPGYVLKNIVINYMIKKFANQCDAIITPTSSTEEYLRNLGVSSLIETIPTGIDCSEYKKWNDQSIASFRANFCGKDDLLLVSVSRMSQEKNLDFLIEGLSRLVEKSDIGFKCILVGGGPEKIRLEKKVSDLGLVDRVFFLGRIPPNEVPLCYLASDIFVFASTSETQGMVLLEAMAGGCPVVAVNASGVYDVIEDGYNGYKVPESVDSWADTVANLMKNRELRNRMSENCKVFAAKFSTDSITEKVLKLYQRVIVLKKSENASRKKKKSAKNI